MAFYVENQNDNVELQVGYHDDHQNQSDKKVSEIMEIDLEYVAHRGHYFNVDDNHPIKLLDKSNKLYCSSKCSSFNKNEYDWIIFKFIENDNKKQFIPIPTKMEIKNGSCKSAVKIMRLYIGNKENNEWYRLINNDINLIKQEDQCQSFDIVETIKFHDLQHIKLEFIENYGENWNMGAKFCVFEFHLYGYVA